MSVPTGTRVSGVEPGTAAGPGRRQWIGLVVAVLAVALDGLAAGLGSGTTDAIQRGLGLDDAAMPSVVFGYRLVLLFALLPAARLGDVFGRKRIFVVGAALYAAASLLCAVAPGAGALTGGRLLQGVSGALMIPQALSLVMAELPPWRHAGRVAGFALYGVVVSFAAPAAPLVDDLVTGADLFGAGWRGLFVALAVAAVLVLAVAAACIPKDGRVVWRDGGVHGEEPDPAGRGDGTPTRPRLDPAGIGLTLLALVLLVNPMTAGSAMGWPPWVFAPMALSILVFAVLARHQRRKARAGGTPLVVPALFRDPAYRRGIVVIAVMSFTILGFFPFFAGYLVDDLGYSQTQGWLASLGWPVGILVASVAEVRFAARSGRRTMTVGASVMAAGVALLVPTFALAGPDVKWTHIAPALLLAGLGKGLMTPAMIHLVLGRVGNGAFGSASGVLLAVQQLGGLVGFTVLGTVLTGIEQALVIEVVGLVIVTLLLLLLPRAHPYRKDPRGTPPVLQEPAVAGGAR